MIAEREIVMYQAVLGSISDGVLMVDCNGKIIVLNPSAKKILGIELADLFGKTYGELFFSRKENDSFNQLFLDAIGSQDIKEYCEVPFIRRDEKHIKLGVTMSLLHDRDHNPLGILAIFKDLSTKNI